MPLDPEQLVNQKNTGKANFNDSGTWSPDWGWHNGIIPTGIGSGTTAPAAPAEQPIDISSFFEGDSSGGGGGADHFFDVNPLDQADFDRSGVWREQDNAFKQSQFEWQKAMDERDYALAQGDLALAQRKQDDANHWQQKGYELDQAKMALSEREGAADRASSERMNSADNASRISVANIDAQSRFQTATIAAQADRYAADQRLREGLANAHNDYQRNKIQLAHQKEMANIAKMEDETKRAIAGQENQISAFNAETGRAAEMGNLALKNNEFIKNMANSPRDQFSLYFMQRGLSPDWDTMAAGGAPAQGQALTVNDPMKAYTPTVTMPTNFNLGAGSMFGQVGNASNMPIEANPYFTGGASRGGGGGGLQMAMSNASVVNPQQQQQQQQSHQQISQGTHGFANGTDFPRYASGTDRFMQAINRNRSGNPMGGGDLSYMSSAPQQVLPQQGYGQQIQTDFGYMPQQASFNDMPDLSSLMQNNSFSGMQQQRPMTRWGAGAQKSQQRPMDGQMDINIMNKKRAMAGNTGKNWMGHNGGMTMPDFNLPEPQPYFPPQYGPQMPQIPGMTSNMYQRPIGRDPQQQNLPMGGSPFAGMFGGMQQRPMGGAGQQQTQPGYTREPNFMVGDSPSTNPFGGGARPEMIENPTGAPIRVKNSAQTMADFGVGQGGTFDRMQQTMAPRFAFGTGGMSGGVGQDVSQQYKDLGMGSMYIGSSGNEHLAGMELPDRIKMLADYGMPVGPGLAGNVTGKNMGQANVGGAFNQRGGGTLPSLQTLNNQPGDETELFRGYAEGVVGMPWQNVLDYIGRPTQMLGSASRSRLAG